MGRKPMRERNAQLEIENFNLKHALGVRVRFWAGVREGGGLRGEVGAEAYMLCGTPVVWIKGDDGRGRAIALTHVQVGP